MNLNYFVSLRRKCSKMKMNRLHHVLVWLSRIQYCRGFGIQSPTDYRFVRYVINEHWPYYAYEALGQNDDWLRRKLGLLYFRLANERQPKTIVDWVGFHDYLQAGWTSINIQSIGTALSTTHVSPWLSTFTTVAS